MKHWLIIDLEATTDRGGWPVEEMEIIEIGAVLISRTGREIDHFQSYVKPAQRPILTEFCKTLTHISQDNIDSAPSLEEVWVRFEEWLGGYEEHLAGWCSWGDYDRRQLQRDWREHRLDSSLARLPHMNLKQRFAKSRQLSRPVSLDAALSLAGFCFHGQPHRALEDARNTARLLPVTVH
ncbi:inhibitor of KinA sporulation pathway (predicted exonuclease) [Pseudomonas duriflava]|uniref:Inhibitor of KinA sporulation pathway (Predicted exonuclease) n=1 Tax=Pseudomonas duriflava TaxID=459528 RepID=A0A562QAM4_9PSED|nr:exonuclease domain-containing protein [Pseudomonas duriflava]TWI53798.1 inhibitor of KinA sporulation pathway (predicted exonuclease) [Pseudomonas duriflava]